MKNLLLLLALCLLVGALAVLTSYRIDEAKEVRRELVETSVMAGYKLGWNDALDSAAVMLDQSMDSSDALLKIETSDTLAVYYLKRK